MIVKIDDKKYDKFRRDAKRKPDLQRKLEYFEAYIQHAEACDNAYILSTIPWKWRKMHKLCGNRNNQYAFGVSPKERSVCYGNKRQALSLEKVTELEVIDFIEDYH